MKLYTRFEETETSKRRDAEAVIALWMRRVLFLIGVILLVGCFVEAFAAEDDVMFEPMTISEWEEMVTSQEYDATHEKEPADRRFAAVLAHIAREGYRLGQLDGYTRCLSQLTKEKP